MPDTKKALGNEAGHQEPNNSQSEAQNFHTKQWNNILAITTPTGIVTKRVYVSIFNGHLLVPSRATKSVS